MPPQRISWRHQLTFARVQDATLIEDTRVSCEPPKMREQDSEPEETPFEGVLRRASGGNSEIPSEIDKRQFIRNLIQTPGRSRSLPRVADLPGVFDD